MCIRDRVKDEKLGLIASHYDGFAQGKAGVLDSMLIPAFSMLIKQGVACAVEGDMKVDVYKRQGTYCLYYFPRLYGVDGRYFSYICLLYTSTVRPPRPESKTPIGCWFIAITPFFELIFHRGLSAFYGQFN